MNTIVVSGKARNCGKTSLISLIIKKLQAVHGKIGVIKNSYHEKSEDITVTDKKEVIEKGNTDTAIFVDKGANKVVYIKSDGEHLQECLSRAKKMMKGMDYVIMEGNSILDYLNPSLIIYVNRKDVNAKPSAVKAEARAHIIVDYNQLKTLREEDNKCKGIPFTFNVSQISCYRTWLIARFTGYKLPVIGERLNKEGIKVNRCQLGLF